MLVLRKAHLGRLVVDYFTAPFNDGDHGLFSHLFNLLYRAGETLCSRVCALAYPKDNILGRLFLVLAAFIDAKVVVNDL